MLEMVLNHKKMRYNVLESSFQGYIPIELFFSDKGVSEDNGEQ